MAAEGMQSHDQSCGNCPTASHPATKKGRINAPILPKPARCAKSDRLLEGLGADLLDIEPDQVIIEWAPAALQKGSACPASQIAPRHHQCANARGPKLLNGSSHSALSGNRPFRSGMRTC